jgi:hypothetical protein
MLGLRLAAEEPEMLKSAIVALTLAFAAPAIADELA